MFHCTFLWIRISFDWVHMRSVLDHFQDPYLALKEAYRAVRDDGFLMIGLTVWGGPSSKEIGGVRENQRAPSLMTMVRKKVRREGLGSLVTTARERLRDMVKPVDDHTFHWYHTNLTDLLQRTGFVIVKEHWQKPPFSMCVYLQARKR